MRRPIVKSLGFVGAVLVGLTVAYYASDFRFGWMSRTERRAARERHAAEIEKHRASQRLAPADPALQPVPSPGPASAAGPPPRAADGGPHPIPYWTAFRGPLRDGHYREGPILLDWPATLRPLWKQPVGGGHASFAIADGKAFTIEQRGEQEVVAAYAVASGRELWTSAWPGAFSEYYGGDGPRATPTWHDGTVFALGAEGELRALDAASGAVRWRTNILEDAGASNLEWGMSASPLVLGDVVVVIPGGGGGQSVVAYDRASGRRVWSALDDRAAYSSPMAATIGGVDQILAFAATRLLGVSADGRQLLWEFPWQTQSGINVAQPLVLDDGRVFLSSGYGMGAAMVRVSRQGERLAVEELWRSIRMKNQFTSSVYHDGFIYGLDEAILACIEAATGDLKWKGGRYGFGQVMLASGHLLVVTEEGELALVRATPERHLEIARVRALEGRTWNHPAMADGVLLVRNAAVMAAFDLARR